MTTPNRPKPAACTLAEHATVSPLARDLSERTLQEFLAFARTPRPSGHTERFLAYLCDWSREHGLDPNTDEFGNFWLDVPATPGFEDFPLVILQAHIDMVCVAAPGYAKDFLNDPLDARLQGDVITAEGTSLGADDGIGLAFALALVSSDAGHGPLRVIGTNDEETTMRGAMNLDPALLDAPLLVNLDESRLGELVVSSAGILVGDLLGQLETRPLDGYGLVHASMWDLPGGHSGMNIHLGRINAVECAMAALSSVLGLGVDARLVSFAGGDVSNAIPSRFRLTLAVPEDALAVTTSALDSFLHDALAARPDDPGAYSVSADGGCSDVPAQALSADDTARVARIVASLPRGVIRMSDVIEGLVRTSSNTGVMSLEEGALVIKFAARSCVDGDLDEVGASFRDVAAQEGLSVDVLFSAPSWPAVADSPLISLMVRSFERIGVPSKPVAVHVGLEPSYFCRVNPKLDIVSLGPVYTGEHSPAETLYCSTVPPFCDAVLHTLQHAKEALPL